MKTIQRHKYKKDQIIETRTLKFEPFPYSEINQVIESIQDYLTPDLLKGRKSLMYPNDCLINKYYGHCYHASQALYYLMDTNKLIPMSGEDYRGEKHWWLQDEENIYDATSKQYYFVNETPPYDVGKKSKWYGWKQRPHQKSLELTKRVLGDRLDTDRIQKVAL
tara:strand:- start:619 stop:1110 length:492 start_codon:yes stop_codon:yes gene_type:complete